MIDLSTEAGRQAHLANNKIAQNFARTSAEVLIEGGVPAAAARLIGGSWMSGEASQLDAAIEAFTVPLRRGDGINELALGDLKRVLTETAAQWHTADSVPKDSAALLIELYPALIGTIDLYEGGQAERVRQVAEDLASRCMLSVDLLIHYVS